MSKFEEMKAMYPPILHELREMKEILSTEAPEYEKLNGAIDNDLRDQQFISSATWSLSRWERFLNVESSRHDDIYVRRAMLINKRSNIPPITIRALQRSVNQFLLNPSAKVKLDHENYHLFATVSAGDLRYETQIFQTVETMKPAHLRFSLSLEYEGIRSGWREETSINQFSCPVPREELYPLNDLIPC